jgi:hypothetical protein
MRKGFMKRSEYDRIKQSGILYDLFPDATGNFERDVDYVFLENRHQRYVDPFEVIVEVDLDDENVF